MQRAVQVSDEKTRFFFELTPDRVLEAVEAAGLKCTGRCMALNSFENRVYDVELDEDEAPKQKHLAANRRIVKFYRPGRWSEQQILEEHEFLHDLRSVEIPAVAPLKFPSGETIRKTPAGGILYSLFPKVGGRAPDELTDEQLIRIGRLLGRIHAVGVTKQAKYRIKMDPETYGTQNLNFLLTGDWIPPEYRVRYERAVLKICETAKPWFEQAQFQRVHGDCHFGNLLWNVEGPFFVDFDDMVRAPAVQDIWLLTRGRDEEAQRQRSVLLEGYEQMNVFDRATLRLIEPLRALRIIHFSAWIARRWEDPAFPLAFPGFGSDRYWRDETTALEEQAGVIQ